MRSKVPDHERAKGAYDRNDWVSEFRQTSLSLESVPLRHVTRYTTTHDPVTKEPSMPQTEVPIERRFHGSVNLVILHLRRVAQSNDIDAGLAAARQLHMFDADNEAFVRRMLALDEALQAGGELSEPITPALADELQACALRLNAADPA